MSEATGARVAIEMTVSKDPAQMWDLVTDVSRIGEWSPECRGAGWLEGTTPAGETGPRAGARFSGRTEFGGGLTTDVICVVTQAQRPSLFEWSVLDPSGDPASPGSVWRYEILTGPSDQVTVRHSFEHGPGVTGLSEVMRGSPDRAQAILNDRLAILREHMTVTLTAMSAC